MFQAIQVDPVETMVKYQMTLCKCLLEKRSPKVIYSVIIIWKLWLRHNLMVQCTPSPWIHRNLLTEHIHFYTCIWSRFTENITRKLMHAFKKKTSLFSSHLIKRVVKQYLFGQSLSSVSLNKCSCYIYRPVCILGVPRFPRTTFLDTTFNI